MSGAVVLPVRQRTPEWLDARLEGIGASEAAAAIGVSEWQSQLSKWAEKLRLVPPQPPNLVMEIGQELEPLIARKYTELTGIKIRRALQLRQHRTHGFMLASLDRRAGRRPVELKYSTRAVGYGEPGTDEVPDDVLAQVLHQLIVLDETEGEVALLKPGAETVLVYRITLTVEAAAAIVEREGEFWDHVQSRTEPPLDGSASTHRALAAMYPRLSEVRAVEADPDTAASMAALRGIRHEQDRLTADRDTLEARIKAAMLRDEATVITAAGVGEISWRPTKPRETTNWQALAEVYGRSIDNLVRELRSHVPELLLEGMDVMTDEGLAAVHAACESLYTEAKPTAPRFGPPKWVEEE
jgi:putative phage-type endonuclease